MRTLVERGRSEIFECSHHFSLEILAAGVVSNGMRCVLPEIQPLHSILVEAEEFCCGKLLRMMWRFFVTGCREKPRQFLEMYTICFGVQLDVHEKYTDIVQLRLGDADDVVSRLDEVKEWTVQFAEYLGPSCACLTAAVGMGFISVCWSGKTFPL